MLTLQFPHNTEPSSIEVLSFYRLHTLTAGGVPLVGVAGTRPSWVVGAGT
jgi:hypothetical protein